MIRRSIAATILALGLAATPAAVGAQTLNGADCRAIGCTGPEAAVDCWIVQRDGWQPAAADTEPLLQEWRTNRVRQRSDGRWEVDVPVEPFRCPEVLPGLRVALEDVPAVTAYLTARARDTGVQIAGESVPWALDLYDWQQLAACESGGDWHINTGNGFYGGVQIALGTWYMAHGDQFAPRPDLASVAEQIEVARRILTAGGESQWGCRF